MADEDPEPVRSALTEADARKIRNYIRVISRQEEHKERNQYIDVEGNREAALLNVNQVIYGRRGSGKSALIAEAKKGAAEKGILAVDVDCEQYKDHSFPKLLIEILLAVLERLDKALPVTRMIPGTKARAARTAISTEMDSLRSLLLAPDDLDVGVQRHQATSSNHGAQVSSPSTGGLPAASIMAFKSDAQTEQRTFTQRERTIETLQIRLKDYRRVIDQALSATGKQALYIFIDDFYHINLHWQVQTFDHLHRLTKGSRAKYKIATTRFNTRLYERADGGNRGVQDDIDYSPLELDYTLENFQSTKNHLLEILRGVVQGSKSTKLDPLEFTSEGSLQRLVWASGGVPRDFMLIFAEAMDAALQKGKQQITKYEVYDAARTFLQRTKMPDLQSDASSEEYGRLMNAWKWLHHEVVGNRLRNVFLVDKEASATQREAMLILQKLQDFRFIHIVMKDTTAANRDLATHRFQAYAIDLGAYTSRLKGKNIRVRPGKTEADLAFREIDIAEAEQEERPDAIRSGGVVINLDDFARGIRDGAPDLDDEEGEAPPAALPQVPSAQTRLDV
ncbi:MAG: hypothetical protein WC876_07195 [Candidatus Thermoplasmatota archaeon]|jgi:hypothetical protein